MNTYKATCIDIWTEGNDNPLRFESFGCNGKRWWYIHEEYFTSDVCTYDGVDFCGTFTECIEVMKKHLNMEVKK